MSSDLSTIEESIKIALDAADAATDVTSEYNKVKREHKKLETKVKQIHRYTTIIFGSSMIAAIVAMIFSSVLYFRAMSDLGVMTTTNREALVIFAENVDDLKDNVKALSAAMESQVALEKQNAKLVEELSSLRKEISVATNALASRVLEQNKALQEVMTKNTEQAVSVFAERIAQSFETRLNELNKGIDAYQKQLLASLDSMKPSDDNNGVMAEISKSQSQLTEEIRSLYKKNEEIFSKIKSSDGLIKYP
jgi:predicted  nucleic acid-binding Zn-ribbon protein